MIRFLVANLLLIAANLASAAVIDVPDQATDVKLNVTAAPEKPEIMLGEPGYVLFKVANPSGRDLQIAVGGDYRNALGRPDSFKVEVVGADGQKVPQPDAKFDMGGITSLQKLPAKGEYVFRLFLPHWATFEKPGRYTLTIRRKLQLTLDAKETDGIDTTATTTITVVATDAVKLGKIIASSGDTMLDRNSAGAERAEQMLTAIHDERVIPYFAALAEKPHFVPRLAACRPLGRYNNDQAFEALKKLTKTTAADIRESATTLALAESSAEGVRHTAVHAISGSPHPQAIPFLWTFANDRYYGVRITVLHKAAELKTPEARAIIQKMTTDENETVRNEAIRYQKLLAGG